MAVDKKSHSKGRLKVTCKGAGTIDYKELNRLQGNLKTLDPEDESRLRNSILNDGISFPYMLWKDDAKKVWIIDAHQRQTVIEKLATEGWEIPPLPVVWIEAKNKKEALRKVAAAASQYGRVTPQGLYDFMKMSSLSVEALQCSFRFPEIDMGKFQTSFFPEVQSVSFNAKSKGEGSEISEDSLGEFKHNCPKCGFAFD